MKLAKKYSEPNTIQQFRKEMEHFFDDMVPFSWSRENGGSALDTWSPSSDISEDENEYLIRMDLPGIDKKKIKVNIQEGRLIIAGESLKEEKEEEKNFIRRERYKGGFYRSFTLPKAVKEGGIKAVFQDGVLKINVPKAEVSKPTSVKIE